MLFERDGECDLQNIIICSDCGYMLAKIVFEFLVAHCSEFIGKIKQLNMWLPLTYDQVTREGDNQQKTWHKMSSNFCVKHVTEASKKYFRFF